MDRSNVLMAVLMTMLLPGIAEAQLSERAAWAANAPNEYRVVPDLTYLTAENWESKLDLYLPRDSDGPAPTLLYFHGGFWVWGSKDASMLNVLPYLEMGWSVVNVEYRLGGVSLAPAAVEDARCALPWVVRNAEQYGIDASPIVVIGHSAGGHLSLTTGMLTAAAGLDDRCGGTAPIEVAAIINWYGPTDVPDLLEGPNRRDPVLEWLGGRSDGSRWPSE